ncbi:MAG TPA: hypothetical protein DDW52_16375 [Planctomycetaceae bacterium]|nr:hypothetical protein [Planctomycetaceae bacterium]
MPGFSRSEATSLTPSKILASLGLLAIASIALASGCTNSGESSVAQKGNEADLADTQDSTQNEAPEAPPAPTIVSPEDLNEDGEIVLQGAPIAEPQIEPPQVSDDNDSELDLTEASPIGGELTLESNAAEDSPSTETGPQVSSSDPIELEPAAETSLASGPTELPSSKPPVPSDSGDSAARVETKIPVNTPPGITTEAQRNQVIAADWPKPDVVLYLSGQQHGYIEPCGCTGLENQKGGLIRRDTLLTSLRDRGWDIVPMDVGNQVRRIGRQATLKFESTVNAFKMMDYQAATLGIDDLKLPAVELIQIAGSDGRSELPFISANVVVFDSSFFPTHKVIEAGGRKIGVTGVLGSEYESKIQSDDIVFSDPVASLKPIIDELKSDGCDFIVLLAHASIEESEAIARQVSGMDIVVTAGGFGEPTLNPEPIEGSDALILQVGTKGMWGGIVGLFNDAKNPIRYQKIAISSQFKDSKRMLEQFANYQNQLEEIGLEGLGAVEKAYLGGSDREFVGSEVCGDCHTTAYDIWLDSPHVHATESIIAANNDRGGIPRHHDPECISCHVTGWDPQGFEPFKSGWESLKASEHLGGSGCENCHGPGSQHVAAENGDIDVTTERLKELQQQMVLTLDRAEMHCRKCHDLDNSPEFDFASYWEEVKHYGKD